MSDLQEKKQEVIHTLCQQIDGQFTDTEREQRRTLAQLFYQESVPKEILSLSLEDMLGAINGLWDFIYQRSPDKVKVQVYQPNIEEHQWDSTHTVIDIVCKNTPFLVSSVNNALNMAGHRVYLNAHPVLRISRDEQGIITELKGVSEHSDTEHLESVMRFEINQLAQAAMVQEIEHTILAVIQDVQLVVADWQPMRQIMQDLMDTIKQKSIPSDVAEKSEILAFLQWALDNNFTFIGYYYCDFSKPAKSSDKCIQVLRRSETGLGTFRPENLPDDRAEVIELSERQTQVALESHVLIINKSTKRSRVHRSAYFDYLGIKAFGKGNKVVGEHRFFGLYASAAYTARINEIPLLRRKAQVIQDHIGALPASHKSKALQHILNNYPRDEMLQAPVEDLVPIIQGVLQTQERHALSLFLRFDKFGRFLTAIIYVPRENFNTRLRLRMQAILVEAFDGTGADFNVSFSDHHLARVQIIVRGQDMYTSHYDVETLEQAMSEAMLSWQDHLYTTLLDQLGEAEGLQVWHDFEQAFPLAYQERYPAKVAVKDIARLQQLTHQQTLVTHLYNSANQLDQHLCFKTFGQGRARALSDVLPVLESMGVKVINARPYEIKPKHGASLWMLDFVIQIANEDHKATTTIKKYFQETFAKAYQGRIDNDGFNGLVLAAGLTWREAELMRAIGAYLRQAQMPFSTGYISATLIKHPTITQALVHYFGHRFDPDTHNQAGQDACLEQIQGALELVTNLNEDRVIRHFSACLQALLRTNYYQLDTQGNPPRYISLKLDPSVIPNMPLPVPKYEIFVYANWMEAVHLRGGKVARGGLRWSDRHEDYRTEVLGLAKAQTAKNAVIVPVGAKGGFVCKQLPQTDDRKKIMHEVVQCYSTFIQAMLDITDNIVAKKVVPPSKVVRYDDDDPYLVVAADKGTATFSDLANDISETNNFWLGDAFASGGTNGYDHKKMGITARGAWESVKRLFVELERDCQTQDFTVVGIGDMAGDVFGNGMLLSKHICLQAAFNHKHIFIDPQPDAATSFVERQRLFALSPSSWSDYDRSIISKGGGIFDRASKSIILSKEIQALIQTQVQSMTPNELIRHLLQMPVDLLWNGGIGTYVKSSQETHVDIGDPSNDALRVDGNQLGAKIVGEGGNLGFSQLGRIEYARAGGLIHTDAIDNSAGVDSSDHEVNIKILLSQIVQSGDLTQKQRNLLLSSMTDEVGQLVLTHNYHQSLVLSIANFAAPGNAHHHKRLMQYLESHGRLDRALQGLPSDADLDELMRQQKGLTRPEIATLLADSKTYLFNELMQSDIAKDKYLSHALVEYFPRVLHKQFAALLTQHPLKAEIIATHIANQIGNRLGATFLLRIHDETGASPEAIVRAFVATSHILDVNTLWQQLDESTLTLPYNEAMELHNQIQDIIENIIRKLLTQHQDSAIDLMIDQYKTAMQTYINGLDNWLSEEALDDMYTYCKQLTKSGMQEETARRLALMGYVDYGFNIAQVAQEHAASVENIGQIWFSLYKRFNIRWLSQAIDDMPVHDAWQRLAQQGLEQTLEQVLMKLTASVIQAHGWESWQNSQKTSLQRMDQLYAELSQASTLDLARLSVALGELGRL